MSNAETARMTALNGLTIQVTAFQSWTEFEDAMKGGYCPTLRDCKVTGRMKEDQRFYNQCVNKLRDMVRAQGYRVFDGKRVS